VFQTKKGDRLATAQQPKQTSDARPFAFELRELSKVYDWGKGTLVRAVEDLSLSVPSGQVVGLLGPTGAGKTTTIKMMCGLVTPTGGPGHLNGYDIPRDPPFPPTQVGHLLDGAPNAYL